MVFRNYIWDEEFELNVSRGKVRGATFVHRFGAVPAMSQNTTGTIWDINDTIYPWSAFSSAGTVTVASDVADNGKKLILSGLDSNYNPIQETLILDSAGVTSTLSYLRIQDAFITDGSSVNSAIVTISKNGTVVKRILTGFGQSLSAIYTIPAGVTGYLYKGVGSAQAGADGTGFMYVRLFGEAAFRVGHSFEVAGVGGQYEYDFSFPVPIPEKSDIDVRITTRTNNGRYTAAFDLLLVDEDL